MTMKYPKINYCLVFTRLSFYKELKMVDIAEFIGLKEGFKPNEYLCPAGKPTIGFGHLITDKEKSIGQIKIGNELVNYKKGLTQKQAELLRDQDIAICYNAIDKLVKVKLTQNQKDALCSWVFNFGETNFAKSTLLKVINENPNDKAKITEQWLRWVHIGELRSAGLQKRREAELQIYFS